MLDTRWGGFLYCTTKGNGPWVVNYPDRLIVGKFTTRSHECVALAQETLQMPHSSKWRAGEKVFEGKLEINGKKSDIPVGTVIATFINGIYPSQAHGNHVAIYIGQGDGYTEVIDQWSSKPPSRRRIYPKAEGQDRSNNATAFSVVYTLP